MGAVAFDTLRLARKLEAAGFSAKQAADTAEALAEAFVESIVTKSDLDARLAITERTFEVKLAELKADLLKWVIGLPIGQTAVIAALLKLF